MGEVIEVINEALGEQLSCISTWQDNNYWYTRIGERSLLKNEVRLLCKAVEVPFTDEYAIFPDDEEFTHDITMELSSKYILINVM